MKVGVVGYGVSGKLHTQGYLTRPEVDAVIIYDPAGALPSTGRCRWVSSADALWAAGIEAVSVCSPPASHVTYVADALSRGIPVLCEKPLAFRAADIAPWVSYADARGIVFAAAFGHRFYAPTVWLQRHVLEPGGLGTLTWYFQRFAVQYTHGAAAWKWNPAESGGGAVLDTLLHSVDLFRFLCGDPDRLALKTVQTRPDLFGPVEDGAVALVSGPSFLTGVLQADWTTPREYTLHVVGTRGWARVDFVRPRLTIWRDEGEAEEVREFPGTALDRFTALVGHFLEAVAGRVPLRCSAAEGVIAMRWIEEATPIP